MEIFNVLIIVFGILTLLMLIIVFFINRILISKNRADIKYESVFKYINERVSLFEKMSLFLEENINAEKKLSKSLKNAKNNLFDISKTNVYNLKEIKKTNNLFLKFKELIKIYPNLNKNKIYNILIKEIDTNVDRMEYAIYSYDMVAKEYNSFKNTGINRYISKMFRLVDYDYYNK